MGGKAHLSDSAVVTVFQGFPPQFSLQSRVGGECGDVWWRGPPLLQGRAQLGTIDPRGQLDGTHGPVSLSL